MRAPIGPLVLALTFVSGCGPKVDVTKGLEVVDVSTGWSETDPVDGQNKLVPSITFKLKNVSDQRLKALHTNAVFRQDGKPDEMGSQFSIVRGSDGLDPGETTRAITLKSLHGYTSVAPSAEMLSHKEFVDVRADLFAKYSSTQWKQIRAVPVERRLASR